MPPPLAYFLTWTCHGTWLHGDHRGSVDSLHNELFSPSIAPDPYREDFVHSHLNCDPFTLSPDARQLVDQTIRRHCELRGWRLLAINVRSNHIHVIVECPDSVSPETAMEQFKAWSTRRLRETNLARADQKPWTEHGSTRWINDPTSLTRAIDYVFNQQ